MVSALHRPLLRSKVLGDFVEYQMLSQRRVHGAAKEISKMSHDLHGRDLARNFPAAASMFQLPAIIILLRELRSLNLQNPQESIDLILPCINVVDDLRELHVGADLAMFFGLDLLKRSNIIPQVDKISNKVTRLCYGSEQNTSNNVVADDGTCTVTQKNGTMLIPPFDGSSDSEACPGYLAGHHNAFAPDFAGPENQNFIYKPEASQAFDVEMDFLTYAAGADNSSDMLLKWNLLPSPDDWWLNTCQPDVPA